ncbi:DUF2634 domain-containing protein [Paenibacillus whitsoniae]|uniref:DUF2634 domain-containing protein n=1 Tax=Paenibacillus whitsoniae TaxID=2496558 RepID=A0A3S0IBE7_9BACL|nr:DUF2634 domain-containing protein [Paenibacillus whitsoniae]RTE09299.1 DUF2634 domain-containing protein [Paenibacillus whitsoniae]
MIPSGGVGNKVLQQVEEPSVTYALDPVAGRIIGRVDGLEAVRQAVYKILQTERFTYLIYGPDYGCELQSLIGKSAVFVRTELNRRIQEALLQDDRIKAIEDLTIRLNGDSAIVTFTVITIYGNFEMRKEV